jgi:2-keto-3-deoxy-L-rhamnonate aldolase RhmA
VNENAITRRLGDGHVVLGTMVQEFMTPAIMPLARSAGAEFVLLDLEHPAWSLETLRAVIAAGAATDAVPIVRVPDAEYHFVARVLDAGARGVMIPNCESADEARAVVEWAKYPPVGKRGFGIPRHELEPEGVGATQRKANVEQMVFLQIESSDGVDQVEEIAAVDGVDVIWVGHFDLTNSLGIPGDFGHPLYEAAIRRVAAAGNAAGKPLGLMVGSVADGRRYLELGFRCFAYAIDAWLYEDALRAGLDEVRSSAGTPGSSPRTR